MNNYSDKALDYFATHAIDPEVAAAAGVLERGGALVFPYGDFERRRLLSDGPAKVRQPKGQPLTTWWPAGRPKEGRHVLVCEGESDALAALTALKAAEHPVARDILSGLHVVAVPGASFPVDRLVRELQEVGAWTAILAPDGDSAGDRFAERATEALRATGTAPSRLPLPEGSDLADVLHAAENAPAWLAGQLADLQAAEQAATEPVEIAAILDAVETFVRRYVVLPSEAASVAIALYIAHTHVIEAAEATLYFKVGSPERQAGKTRLLEVMELLVHVPWRVAGASEAAVFRKLEQDRPTLLLDEVDAIFGSNSERTEPLRAILNAGNRRGASVARIVGKDHKVVDFCVFGCKLLAGISTTKLPDTIADRSLSIEMQRRRDGERVERFRYRRARELAEPIRAQLEGWAETAVEALRDAEPELPEDLSDRQADGWEPLLAIADLAGGDWPVTARRAAVGLSVESASEEVGWGAQVLAAIRRAMEGRDTIWTAELLAAINEDDDLPFGGWRDGKGLDARGLARLLKPYAVKPRSIRVGTEVAKGYARDDLTEVWERYLKHPAKDRYSVTSPTATPVNPSADADCDAVTDVTPHAERNVHYDLPDGYTLDDLEALAPLVADTLDPELAVA